MSEAFEILYAAHTASCTFLLDSEGICRRIQLAKAGKSGKANASSRAAARCVGAQYVASLDPTVSGMLAEMPRVGAAMLFARVDERGRVSLVRTGVVTRFEGHHENPFAGGKGDKSEKNKKNRPMAPSESVETSAPILPPSATPPRRREPATVPGRRPLSTDAIQTVRAEDLPRLTPPTLSRSRPMANDFDTTTPYEPKPAAHRDPRATTWPSAAANLGPNTIRQPPPVMDLTDDSDVALLDDEEFSSSPPPPPPRRSEPFMTRVRADRTERMPARPADPARPPSYPSLDQLARRRGDR